jgi:acetate kinase
MDSVHGGERKEGLVITKDHTEGLEEMDKLSDFAPLHVGCRPQDKADR